MPNKRKAAPKRIATKRQLATWQRQRRLQRITVLSGIAIIFVVLALMGYGYYDSQLKPLYQPALRVNNTILSVKDFARMLRIQAAGYKLEQMVQVVDQVATRVENGELIAQSARRLNISVSPKEVEQSIIERFSTGSEGKQLNEKEALKNYQQMLSKYKISDEDFRKVTELNLLQDKLRENVAKEIPTIAPQINAQVVLLPAQDEALKVRGRLEQGEDFSKVAKEVSLFPGFTQEPGELGWLPQSIMSKDFDQSAFSLEPAAFSQPVWDNEITKQAGYWIAEVQQKLDQSVHARGILLGSKTGAEEIRAKLLAGEDFELLLKEHSQDSASKSRAGDLGWRLKDEINQFTKALFALEPNTWSTPIFDDQTMTTGGYWIIKVKEKAEAREIDKNTRELLINKAFNEWLEKEKKASTIENYLDDLKKVLIAKLASK